jgi:hypothetical protein
MNWKGYERKRSSNNLWQAYYTGICLEGLRKTTKFFQDSRSLGRDLNQGSPEYEALGRNIQSKGQFSHP